MTIDFGDIEPEDSYDVDSVPDPDQVAVRLHELRAAVEELIGKELPRYDDLTPAEQDLARAIGAAVVTWLVSTEPDVAEDAARQLHAVRVYWSGGTLPAWDDLPEDNRVIATQLMQVLIDWLERQGPL